MSRRRSAPARLLAVSVLGAGSLLAGCTAVPSGSASAVRPPVVQAPAYSVRGLEGVMGHRADDLVRLFGEPRLDVREAAARKLQFGTGTCVLDAYLYARAAGQEGVVTHVDARRPDGQSVDRAACVAALARR